jgi:hypothetical protein
MAILRALEVLLIAEIFVRSEQHIKSLSLGCSQQFAVS